MTQATNNYFSGAIRFIKENASVAYSLFLFILIPAAFLINNYLMSSGYEKVIDDITRRKASTVENVINNLVQNNVGNGEELQSTIKRIMLENEEIISLSILTQAESGDFKVIASSDAKTIGKTRSGDTLSAIVWNKNYPVAAIDKNNETRYWKVTSPLYDNSRKKIGLVEMLLSLQSSDDLVNKVITDSYWILIITILVVVLSVANQVRLMDYAYTVTKLKEIDRMKDMFISMASHELRTPLTAIKGYLDLMKGEKDLAMDKESSHYLQNISLSTERLDSLVEDILVVSRIEGNRLPLELSVFDPNPVIAQSVEELRSQAIQKGLALNFKPADPAVKVKADADRLKQIAVNLIGNALKYTAKGSIDVTMSQKNNELQITVADTGFGISSEDQSKLFQKFSRIKTDNTRDIIGTGLGLWITAEIIRRMQGKITVESIEGVGSHFTVHLPLAKK